MFIEVISSVEPQKMHFMRITSMDKKDKIEIVPIDLDVDLDDLLKRRRGVISSEMRKRASEIVQQVKERKKSKKREENKELYANFEILLDLLIREHESGGAVSLEKIAEITGMDNMISFSSKFNHFLKSEKENGFKIKRCQRNSVPCYKLIPM
jgi:predicted HTH domain antitoxin